MYPHKENNKENRLIISAGLNFATTVAQIIGGIFSGSLSLISDALHNLSDTVALVISFFAVRLAMRKNTEAQTFGYKRAEILAALFNACALVMVSIFLFKEAFSRFFHPHPVNSLLMLFVAAVGLAANIISVFLLKAHAHEDLNVRAAYVHLFSDFLSSIAVIIGACVIFVFRAYWIDPALTILIAIYVLKEGYRIIEESIHILMQHVPRGINLREIQARIECIDGIKDIHHAHLWAVTERDIHFEAHINLSRDMAVSETCLLAKQVEEALKKHFTITHVTLQIEFNSCKGVSLIKA
ncbi:MAG: cation diffusion facilitator family transporter [Candidatus Portnoybacteria bacterium]|jgi:cobalt-zinc-cadmium efflux system protein|nr:cation diffusion facilitator family transporter [Candidatus Portnoybacteria bacterium]